MTPAMIHAIETVQSTCRDLVEMAREQEATLRGQVERGEQVTKESEVMLGALLAALDDLAANLPPEVAKMRTHLQALSTAVPS